MDAAHPNGGANGTSRHWPVPAERPQTAVAESPDTPVAYQVPWRVARSPQDARYLVKRLDEGTLAELRVLSGDLGASAGLVRAFTEQAERVATAARGCPGIASVHECERIARGALLLTVERPQGPT